MNQRHLLTSLAILAAPSLALAQPEPPPPPPSPAPAEPAPAPQPALATQGSPSAPMPAPMMAPGEPAGGPPLEGWQLQARLPTTLGTDSLLSPGFSIGHRS